MNYYNNTQKVVVEAKIRAGYSVVGATTSNVNGVVAFMLTKAKHTVVVNSLGYDEHTKGSTWRLL